MDTGHGRTAEPPERFDTYQIVLLRRPQDPVSLAEPAAERLQSLHLGYLASMREAGHMKVAGPLSSQPDDNLRGVCLYQVSSLDEARTLAEADPAVRAGVLEVSLMLWHVPSGSFGFS